MLENPGEHVVTTFGTLPDHSAASAAGESTLLYYLCQSYARAQHELQNALVSSLTYYLEQKITLLLRVQVKEGYTCFSIG